MKTPELPPFECCEPVDIVEGKRLDVLYIAKGDDALNEKSWASAKETLEKGGEVLMGTEGIVNSFVFSGARS